MKTLQIVDGDGNSSSCAVNQEDLVNSAGCGVYIRSVSASGASR